MCMSFEYMFLMMVIPGPSNPKHIIDVYLKPLIEELQNLWHVGVLTHDSTRDVDSERPTHLWDGFWMEFCWCYGVSVCMEDTRGFYLQNDRKACYFDCYRQFLPPDHPYRRNKKAFTKNQVERKVARPRLAGEQIRNWVEEFSHAVEVPLSLPDGYSIEHKWTKKSIFWELEYWSTHLIRHNLDMCTLRIILFVINQSLRLTKEKPNVMPKAIYTLTREQNRRICEWITRLKFPDGYASNLACCVDMKELKLHGMKSHDCHVFMQKLIPIAFHEMFPESMWSAL
ncbi:UNVERIFIED_CONTAM: hypothetical protein Sradi_6168500 [Sesamum radiatum]|uniref:Uncharacterized protein n=1 Tax=Sesamum radiatum TaxID=300843 RepID=A0AAW2K8N0_SESRA